MGPGLTVPPIFTPIPPAIHPCHVEADALTAAWAETYRIGSEELRARLVSQSIGTFSARILPEGREEVVSLLADFVLWLFGVDDGYCEEGELGRRPGELAAELHRLLRVAQNPQVPMLDGDPLAAGLRDLRLRIDRYGTPGQAARWVDALREYFFSVVWEASHRRAGTVPDLNDYTLMRIYDGATTVVLPMLEIGHGYELQPHERDRTAVRAATEMASFVITWDNDIFSYHKENKEKSATGYYLNVLRVLEEHEGMTPSRPSTSPSPSATASCACTCASPRPSPPRAARSCASTCAPSAASSAAPRTGASPPSATRPRTTRPTCPPTSATPPSTPARSRSAYPPSPGGGTCSPRAGTRTPPCPCSGPRGTRAKDSSVSVVTTGSPTVPRAPGAVPLLGHAWRLWRDPLGFLKSLRQAGDIVQVRLGTMPVYVVTSAELIHEVTVRQARSFEKGRLFDRLRPSPGTAWPPPTARCTACTAG